MRAIKTATALVLVGACCGGLSGCGSGSGSDLPLVPVSGRVTFEGGPPPAGGKVTFVQVSGSGLAGMPNRPAQAGFGTDGYFAATSFEKGDGLLPGRYIATVICMDGEPTDTRPFEKITYVPLDYKAEELVVEEGQNAIEVNYNVPLKK